MKITKNIVIDLDYADEFYGETLPSPNEFFTSHGVSVTNMADILLEDFDEAVKKDIRTQNEWDDGLRSIVRKELFTYIEKYRENKSMVGFLYVVERAFKNCDLIFLVDGDIRFRVFLLPNDLKKVDKDGVSKNKQHDS